ncbi:MAG: aspartate-semialdehyde dehydrogenase [Erysipelotrichales bacterium]|nr:MAG: aspartate-semialdehyde dehydrogenase [Erysipelotrichales bacterium]
MNVAILGATGMVGREMIKVLEERNFPVDTLKLLASRRSVGQTVMFNGKEIGIEEANDQSFNGMDFVFGAVSNPMAEEFAPIIVKAGALFIDNSSAFRMQDAVPLIIPEINPKDAYKHQGIIANPNCSTIIAMMALHPIQKRYGIKNVVACTYQAVSGAGQEGTQELLDQIKCSVNGDPAVPKVFAQPIAYNVIPCIGAIEENGYTSEEMKMRNEGRKILHQDDLNINCTCVRVPVLRSHSIAMTVKTNSEVNLDQIRKDWAKAPGIGTLPKDRSYPTPLDSSDQDLVLVGRLRNDLNHPNKGVSFWCCGDQVRKGAATNAIQIAELFVK